MRLQNKRQRIIQKIRPVITVISNKLRTFAVVKCKFLKEIVTES